MNTGNMSNDEAENIGIFIEQINSINMNTKEKAKELILKYKDHALGYNGGSINKYKAKQCALIMVNEILEELNFTHIGYGKEIIEGYKKTKIDYWNEVKKEIENY